ncbi:hypothetical protein CEP54_008159 [Fusarium duplospermum]|uniref:Uncharacterized protein n=1 Tax=Fusarium duplospermum TaxID=1325734 RepID=A0A428PXF1_9HYPO|nr:hypothetical protein CEP54_008159 [Fusarium duplospermum]
MGYYDEDVPKGHCHSFRSRARGKTEGCQDAEETREIGSETGGAVIPNVVTIPCHDIRLGDFLVLEGRPCRVIRISTSRSTGQYRYLGVDLFTKQLHEETSFVSNPAPSVVVQTMLGPTFKQYRVLDIQEGQIVAMTETGDVKQGLPVLDQSNLYARLSQAFESGSSVRILVLECDGRELVVDMKDDMSLHIAARNGQESMVREFLQEGAGINRLDRFGRTALFGAVENNHEAVVRLLAAAYIELNVVDTSGTTALDLAVSSPKSHSTADILLERGASPTKGVSASILLLLSASAKGDTEEVSRLLSSDTSASATSEIDGGGDTLTGNVQRAQPNGHDRLGYTALHEAACFGHHQIVSMLIEHGAKVDKTNALGRETALHAVVERGRKHRRFLDEPRKDVPRLGKGHVQVVELLLQEGASVDDRRQDGLTVQDLVSKELISRELSTTEQSVLQQILVLLKSLSTGKEATEGESRPQAVSLAEDTRGLCNSFELKLQYHLPRRNPEPRQVPIGDFLYGQGVGSGVIQDLLAWADGQSGEEYWRWAHLPMNNKVWAEDIIGPLSGLEDTTLSTYSTAMKAFIGASYHEVRGPAPHAQFRRPLLTPLLGFHGGVFSLVIPFFGTEVLECLPGRECRDSACGNNLHKRRLKKIYDTHSDNPGNLHLPFTLDQSYYLSLTDSTYRDEDQVVVKYAKRQEQESGRGSNSKGLLMVNQMWLWKVDAKTVITALPDHQHQRDKPNLFNHISGVMGQEQSPSLDSMILRMIKCAIDFVDMPIIAGLNENLFDIFEQSIAHWAQKEATCYRAFHQAQETPRDLSQPESRGEKKTRHDEETMCDIFQEVGYIREIKDIKDELKMIERVLEDQKTVVGQYEATQGCSPLSETDTLEDLKRSLLFRISKVQKLSQDASSVEDSLNHLLDIKQKQGNLNVARDTRRLADQAERRALDGEGQTKLLFIFTVVTVVFTPVSFVCAFLAVPARGFPRDDDDGDVAWGWWQVFVGALVTEVATLVAVVVYWAAQKEPDEIAALYQRFRSSRADEKPLRDEESQRPQALMDEAVRVLR